GFGDFFDGRGGWRVWKNWFDHLHMMTLFDTGVVTICEFGGHVTLQHPVSSGPVWPCVFLVSTSEAASVAGAKWGNKVSTP
ncbi:MAG TPA: hypothetical protein VNO32_50170, partial [Candidatus Acidoferrum sp.]|nr:hypothetical protein [Candidatus Acidoferrum sp.]